MKTHEPFWVRLRFKGDLSFFLKHRAAPGEDFPRLLNEPTSVKDVIESCGVPHPEVDRILVDGIAVDFSCVLRRACFLEAYPVRPNDATIPGEPLQHRHLNRFVADGHLGKLARNLRLLGFDVAYDRRLDDRQLLHIMQTQQRALLTRDRRLLMHSIVNDGYCPRSSNPLEQTVEVMHRFNLTRAVKSFSRCLHCNGELQSIDKAAVLEQLEPLTRLYYHEFRRCAACGKIFWRGSHFSKLEQVVKRFSVR